MQKSNTLKMIILLSLSALFISACASTPKVRRTEIDEQIDLSGNWNDTDSQLVATQMINESLSTSWIQNFTTKNQTKPRVIVGTVLNKSHEHINTETFVKDLERTLINSGKVKFIASKIERDEIRDEKRDQAINASMKTAKSIGQETAADYMLRGQINTILDEAGKQSLKYYQIELELIDIETNEKIWMGQKKIKKLIKRSKSKL